MSCLYCHEDVSLTLFSRNVEAALGGKVSPPRHRAE